MQTSATRILTTHTGSLPRPEGVPLPGTEAAGSGRTAGDEELASAVADVVRLQVQSGIDVVNDGEQSKPSYSTYVTKRLTGYDEQAAEARVFPGTDEFPEFFARFMGGTSRALTNPVCTGSVTYVGQAAVLRDIANLKAAARGLDVADLFMTAASPGVIAQFMVDRFYASHEDYVWALADAMREEYETIAGAGIILQLDCPDLASWPVYEAKGMTKSEFVDMVRLHVAAINRATAAIPPESMRLHVCWGNYEGPHNRDIPLDEIIEPVLGARPIALLFEAANPRHEHEWTTFERVAVPDDKILVPGVLDSTTNYIEHPELVAQRLERFAGIVGIERVIAGTDCGFATFAHSMMVDPRIVWAKLAAMAQGAAIASRRLAGARG